MHLHTRLTPDFLPLLLPALLSILNAQPAAPTASKDDKETKDREKDEKDRLARQRPVLRIVAELALVSAWEKGLEKGVNDFSKALQAFVSVLLDDFVLRFQMSGDPQFANLPLMITFLKNYARAFLGPLPVKDDPNAAAEDGNRATLPAGVDELIPAELQEGFRSLFNSYFDTASKTLAKGHMVSGIIRNVSLILSEIARARQEEPRGVYQVWRNLRGSPAILRTHDTGC